MAERLSGQLRGDEGERVRRALRSPRLEHCEIRVLALRLKLPDAMMSGPPPQRRAIRSPGAEPAGQSTALDS